jgi:hypothetical protein
MYVNGTQRLYRARPQGLAELKAFLETFWRKPGPYFSFSFSAAELMQ